MATPVIAVGVDFSEGSRRALQAVSALARGAPARLVLVHALPPRRGRKANVRASSSRVARQAVAVEDTDEARRLSAMAERLRKQGFDVDTVVAEGKPAKVLLAEAKRARAGLVAVGTTGKQGFGRRFLGSAAQAVLRGSTVPVLVTPERNRQGNRRSGPVLAALDLDGTAPAVLAAAAGLASDLGVKVHAFHAIRFPLTEPAFPQNTLQFTPASLSRTERDVAGRLQHLATALRRRVALVTVTSIGDPPTGALLTAQRAGASAIVIGRRKAGRRLGSVSAALVQMADRPVVVVPSSFPKAPAKSLGFGPAA